MRPDPAARARGRGGSGPHHPKRDNPPEDDDGSDAEDRRLGAQGFSVAIARLVVAKDVCFDHTARAVELGQKSIQPAEQGFNGLDEFDLLVHYDLAWVYNSPVETLAFKFADAARARADLIGDDPGAFDKIFLFVPHNEAQSVFQLYPRA